MIELSEDNSTSDEWQEQMQPRVTCQLPPNCCDDVMLHTIIPKRLDPPPPLLHTIMVANISVTLKTRVVTMSRHQVNKTRTHLLIAKMLYSHRMACMATTAGATRWHMQQA